jgi:putative transposase
MSKTTTIRHNVPVDEPLDPELLAFRRQFDDHSPLDDIIHEGACRMLQAAIDAEVDAFIETHQHRRDEQGCRLVVKNGSLPAREILTSAGAIQVK